MSWKRKVTDTYKTMMYDALRSGIPVIRIIKMANDLSCTFKRKGIRKAVRKFKKDIKPMRAA